MLYLKFIAGLESCSGSNLFPSPEKLWPPKCYLNPCRGAWEPSFLHDPCSHSHFWFLWECLLPLWASLFHSSSRTPCFLFPHPGISHGWIPHGSDSLGSRGGRGSRSSKVKWILRKLKMKSLNEACFSRPFSNGVLRKCSWLRVLFCIYFIFGYTQLWSVLIPDPTFRDHSWSGSGDHLEYWGLNTSLLYAKQELYQWTISPVQEDFARKDPVTWPSSAPVPLIPQGICYWWACPENFPEFLK